MMWGDKGIRQLLRVSQVGEVRNRQVKFVFEIVLKIAELGF